MAAARKQAPIVAVNALSVLAIGEPVAGYDGYGSCPLTVEAGKFVLAEFGYGGKLLPSFPSWLIDGTRHPAPGTRHPALAPVVAAQGYDPAHGQLAWYA